MPGARVDKSRLPGVHKCLAPEPSARRRPRSHEPGVEQLMVKQIKRKESGFFAREVRALTKHVAH